MSGVSGWQHNQHVADVLGPAADDFTLTVYVARWPGMPAWYRGPKRPAVMWRHGNTDDYLPPADARRFAAALLQAADEAERDPSKEA